MTNYNTAQEQNKASISILPTPVTTGDHDKRMHLYYQLIHSMKNAKRIDIIVSFLMESGVKMLLKDLERAMDQGTEVRILTGNYLGITQPSALYLIKQKLGDRVDLRFYNEKERSFHPKSYIFHYYGYSDIYIGSSNISRSALTSGIEWNYRFSSRTDKENFDKFYRTFEDLFNNHFASIPRIGTVRRLSEILIVTMKVKMILIQKYMFSMNQEVHRLKRFARWRTLEQKVLRKD